MRFKINDVITFPGPEGKIEEWKIYRREFGPKGVSIWRFTDVKNQYENDLGLTEREIDMNLARLPERVIH